MTRYARLTWQAPDPSGFAPALAARLGVEARAGGLVVDAWTIDLGSAWLEVRPWVREGPSDNPTPGGRLMLEPVPGGEDAPEDPPGDPSPRPLRLVGVGWATVELDRADDELGPWLGDPVTPATDADPHLGASIRARGAAGMPGDTFLLLEPHTEGRLAASLARDGEGPCALYLRPVGGLAAWVAAARAREVTLSARRAGPFGTQVIVVGGGVAGPHLLLVDTPRAPKGGRRAGTIEA